MGARDLPDDIKTNAFYDEYFEVLFRRLSLAAELTDEDKAKIRRKIMAKSKPIPLVVENNYRDTVMDTDSEEILDLIFGKKPHISGYGVLFNNKPNIPGRVLEYLLKERKVKKHLMFQHINDEDKTMYNKLDVEQKVIKVLANAYYGAFGQRSFHFYNPYLGPAVTYTGQHIILSAVLGFEAFLSDNFFFNSFDQLVKYVDNIVGEEDLEMTILDEEVSVEEVYTRLVSKCSFEMNEDQEQVLGGIVDNLPYSQLERLYLKNNLYVLLNKSTEARGLFEGCYDTGFMNPDEPPEAIADDIETLNAYFEYFVAYPYQWDNKYDIAQSLKRKTVLLSDTDSTFLNVDPAVRWFQETFDKELDTDGKIVVCNIMVFAITKFIEKVFYQLTSNLNVREERKKLVNMKSEFNYSRIILTKNKKQYAGLVVLQEGKRMLKPKFDVKGLSIKKVGTPKIARQYFSDVLEKSMLMAKEINPLVPFKQFLDFERQINDSLLAGETKFLKPGRFKMEKAYAEPLSQPLVRGVRLWNAMFPEQVIPNFSSVRMLKLRVSMEDLPNFVDEEVMGRIQKYVADAKELLLERAEKFDGDEYTKALAKADSFQDVSVICVPKDTDNIPDEIIPLIDTNNIINDNMKNGNILLESIGFKVIKSLKFEAVSNIIEV